MHFKYFECMHIMYKCINIKAYTYIMCTVEPHYNLEKLNISYLDSDFSPTLET